MRMIKITFFPIIFCIIMMFVYACAIKDPITESASSPVLSDLSVPDSLYLQSSDQYPIHVQVYDPQGLRDILAVTFIMTVTESESPVLLDTLRDEGAGSDILARDGVYSSSLDITFTGGNEGTYVIEVMAEDNEQNMSNTILDTMVAVDKAINRAPILNNPTAPDSLTKESVSDIFVSIQVWDADGIEDIDSVYVQFFPPLSPVPSLTKVLNDEGIHGDVMANDGAFSTVLDLSDDPPVLSNLVAPDTISRQNEIPRLMAIQVTDAQGLNDIQSIYFNTTKPDGSPAQGNPFFMYDDGDIENHGDQVEGDGIYSTIIIITAQNDLGDYRFEFIADDYTNYSWISSESIFRFQAIDKKGLKSQGISMESLTLLENAVFDTITHIITVVE